MRTSTGKCLSSAYVRRLAAFSLAILIGFSIFGLNGYSRHSQQPGENRRREQRRELKTGKTEPRQTRGAPYPPAKPSKRIPNPDPKPQPVPTGPKVGDMKPANPEFQLKQITDREGKVPAPTRKSAHAPDTASLLPPPAPLFF